ncbi:c-type cytochrome [Roseibium sp. TrichSKD4]|uniref:c-type cytochrome n=1 Tax=Roseibium sp. TrichSKD4 TaxID=744980 RepID=UPI00058E804B|nr:c-type cytochrome [Roseibium sp. TrichSKD4]
MSKLVKSLALTSALVASAMVAGSASAGDAAKGEKVFKKCKACHAVGDGAKNKVGPQLNEIYGRAAGSIEGYKYSKAMIAAGTDGLVWDEDSLTQYLKKPKDFVKGTKMAFAGLRKDADMENILAYLATFSSAAPSSGSDSSSAEPTAEKEALQTAAATSAPTSNTREGGVFGLGRKATDAEVAAWDIDIRPDGQGLPVGSGSVADGEPIYTDNCAVCHGDFGEGVGRWPILAGGHDTLTDDRPEKTIGSYWPYLSTVYDYVRRAMPFGNARSLSDDDVYAITAYLLYLNDIVDDEEFVLSNENFLEVRLPNEENFIPDARYEEPHYAEKSEPCMKDCKADPIEITMRAAILDVTPEDGGDDSAGVGAVD